MFCVCLSSNNAHVEYKRRRHHSGISTGDFDDANDDLVFLELRYAVEIFDGNFSWNLETKELALKNISVKFPMGNLPVSLYVALPHASTPVPFLLL